MVNRYSNYQKHLIHDWRNFSADSIRKKVGIYDFTQPTEFEVLIWNYELYGHLQQLANKKLVLKGGAAAQRPSFIFLKINKEPVLILILSPLLVWVELNKS